jgi:hypothetical protein
VKSYENKNQLGLYHLKLVDNQIDKIGQEVEFSMAAISNLK